MVFFKSQQPLSKVKLNYLEEEQTCRMNALLPKDLSTIKGTLIIHQVIATTSSTFHYRVLSCFCNRDHLSLFPTIGIQHCTKWTDWKRCNNSKPCSLTRWTRTPFHPEDVVLPSPTAALEVKVMHRIGRNRYFWPRSGDKIWFTSNKVITRIDPPKKIDLLGGGMSKSALLCLQHCSEINPCSSDMLICFSNLGTYHFKKEKRFLFLFFSFML